MMKRSKRLASIEQLQNLRRTMRPARGAKLLPPDTVTFPGRHSDAETTADIKALRNRDNRRHRPKGKR